MNRLVRRRKLSLWSPYAIVSPRYACYCPKMGLFFLWHAVIMHGIYCVCSTVQVRAAILTCAGNRSIIGWIQRPCVIITSIWDNEVLLFYYICRSSCSRGGRWFEDDVEHCVGVRSGDHLSDSFTFCSSTTQNQALLSAPGHFTLSFPLRC